MRTLAGIVVLVVGISCVVLYRSVDPSIGFLANAEHGPWGSVALMVLATLAGIVFGRVHGALSRVAGPVRFGNVVLAELRESGFWASLLASPVLFGAVYAVASNQPDPVIAAVFAFENGFFCERILERRPKDSL